MYVTKMLQNVTKLSKNEQQLYQCLYCDYVSSRKYNVERHLLRCKTENVTKCYKMLQKGVKMSKNEISCENICFTHNNENNALVKMSNLSNLSNSTFCEKCLKIFNNRQGLWRHRKYCLTNYNKNINEQNNMESLNIVDKVLTQQKELTENVIKDMKEIVIQIAKIGTNTISNVDSFHTNNNNNSNNKAFCLNFFLNETCKNAMNISEFVDSIKLQLSDLIELGEIGYVEKISNIIVKELNKIDETMRPLHCTDQKRETFYIKDNNEWNKEDENYNRLKKMINKVVSKNEKLLPQFKEKHPDYICADSIYSDQYSKIIIEVVDFKEQNKQKIIKNISKATLISKK